MDRSRRAPLEPHEREELEVVLPQVRQSLRTEALAVIEKEGVWEKTEDGRYATTCVDGAECVFVIYEGPVAKCAIQQAYRKGTVAFPKPISCHLYPVRIESVGDFDTINYEQIDLCRPAIALGKKENTQLVEFLKAPLVRKYGEVGYEQFRAAYEERRKALGHQPDQPDR